MSLIISLLSTPAKIDPEQHQIIGGSMSARHKSVVRGMMRRALGEMKRFVARLKRVASREKQTEEKRASPAAEQFFSTPELLELMLLELPMQDLLLAERVCLRFKATIDGSIKIRRALFFEPEPVAKDGMEVASRVNPLLTEESQLHRRRFLISGTTPLCRQLGRKLPISIMVKIVDEGVGIEREHIDCFLKDATYFSNGSWRRMLVAQSPDVLFLQSFCGNALWLPERMRPAPNMEVVCKLIHVSLYDLS
ncbi:hypothetical protein D0864_11336 [Hortaea werneckii]|uniref:F-box domain-containing protein n=1 Tax=Hortaea werneckii TaxID=91943 RepID=A0A3M7DW80_HORWE|nr:hypothetical protein D0864_11336 [Hortaea werneckii]